MSIDPNAVLAAACRPSHWSGRIPTFTNRVFNPFDPRPEDIDPKDIAWGLAHKPRYGGHINPAVTVAEHVCLVERIIDMLWPESGLQVVGLLHDACEAYTHDIQSPIRKLVWLQEQEGIYVSWDSFDRTINNAVFEKFGLDSNLLDAPEVHAADLLACCLEKRDSLNFSQATDWGLPPIPKPLQILRVGFLYPNQAHDVLRRRMAHHGIIR